MQSACWRSEEVTMTNGNDNPIDASEQLIELRARNAALQETIEELASNLEQANVKRYAAEQRLIKTRGSLTYQLGYQLKTGLGSLSGGVRLPWALFNLYRKASKQRKRAEHKSRGGVRSSKPSPFQAPSPEKIFVPQPRGLSKSRIMTPYVSGFLNRLISRGPP